MDGALMVWCFLIVFLFSMSLYVVIKQKMYKTFGVIAILLSVFSIIWVAMDCYKKTLQKHVYGGRHSCLST